MGAISSALGFGTNNGAQFQAQNASLSNPYNANQVNQSIAGAQGGIGQQQAFLNALQAQNGIANQSSVYNQLQGVANGTGPNPAQAMLNQSTGQNVQNQAALMAGQRGASQNAGLIARQASQQGANLQQQAVGQGATMQANQSLNALGQLGGLATQQVGQQQNALGTYNNLLQGQQAALMGGLQNQNQNILGNTQQANSSNASIAGVNAGTQGKILGGLLGGSGTALAGATGGQVKSNQIGNNPKMMADGGSPTLGLPQFTVPDMSNVANIASQGTSATSAPNGPKSSAGKFFAGANSSMNNQDPVTSGANTFGNAIGSGLKSGISSVFGSSQSPKTDAAMQSAPQLGAQFNAPAASLGADTGGLAGILSDLGPAAAALAKGGEVPALLSPGERYLNPAQAKAAKAGKIDASKSGEKVPGQAKVKGNSLKNDTVPATLQTGGLVIPKSVMESKNPSKEASKFIAAVLAKSKHGAKK